MTAADFFQRHHAAFLILVGRVALPDVSPKRLEVAMAFEKTKSAVAQLQGALTRAAAAKAASEAQIAQDATDKAALQSELDAADAQIESILQPAVDQANALAPAAPSGADAGSNGGAAQPAAQ